jgi:hypothetical protein
MRLPLIRVEIWKKKILFTVEYILNKTHEILEQTALRSAGEIENTQENIPDWFELAEGDPVFQLLVLLYVLNKGSPVMVLYLFPSALSTLFFFLN